MTLNAVDIQRLLEARHPNPFEILGRHPHGDGVVIRAHLPGAAQAAVRCGESRWPMQRYQHSALFEWHGRDCPQSMPYTLEWQDAAGQQHADYDTYAFTPMLNDAGLSQFTHGRHYRAYQLLGAHPFRHQGVEGVRFAVWAPNAERVSVVGDFNQWDGRCHPMRRRGSSGVWELFIPAMPVGSLYKFELRDRHGGIHLKSDPYGRRFEKRPANAAIIEQTTYSWQDRVWMSRRAESDWRQRPISIYEVHLGSWQRNPQGEFLTYRELAEGLIPHVKRLGFTHIELLPITEHPLDGSWGYQTTGYFAPTSRFGSPDDLRWFIDQCHGQDIGIILDWVPAHFPRDAHALARFDGTPLYEHADPRRGEHRDWGTLIFNYNRNEVRNFLLSSALYWLDEFHIDGLRVDAVASMLYLDYSREPGDWLPNIHGGNENLEAVDFLREMNTLIRREHPGALTMAEESTAWPMVSRPVDVGGLGFSMKWNLGWMHDTLTYFHHAPVHRKFHHENLTFGLLYAFSENFILPFSHDEVVHLKRSLLEKMPGDDWQRFANLRLLYTYLFTMPGKKLLFMGAEFAQRLEWNHDTALEWHLYDFPSHHGIHRLLVDLNRLYCNEPSLHRFDFDSAGFQWLDCENSLLSVLSYLRIGGEQPLVVSLNFTLQSREGFRIGVPETGNYALRLTSDASDYGGNDQGPPHRIEAENTPWMGQPCSVVTTLPPLTGIILQKT